MSRTKDFPAEVRRALERSAALHNVTVDEIVSNDHHIPLPAARASAARELREKGRSLSTIGRYLGVHHTTVLYYLRNRQRSSTPEPTAPLEPTQEPTHNDPNAPDESGVWAI